MAQCSVWRCMILSAVIGAVGRDVQASNQSDQVSTAIESNSSLSWSRHIEDSASAATSQQPADPTSHKETRFAVMRQSSLVGISADGSQKMMRNERKVDAEEAGEAGDHSIPMKRKSVASHIHNYPPGVKTATADLQETTSEVVQMQMHKELDGMALQYDGWDRFRGNTSDIPVDQPELNKLVSDPHVQTVCETGFSAGHSALRWLFHSRQARVYSFDIGEHTYSKPLAQWIMSRFPGRLSVLWGNSTDTIPQFSRDNPTALCNLVFVDGSRDFSVVSADLRNFASLVDPTYNKVVFVDTGRTKGWQDLQPRGRTEAWQDLVANGTIANERHVTDATGNWGFSVGHYVLSNGESALNKGVNLTQRAMFQKLDDIAAQYGGLAEGDTDEIPQQQQEMTKLASDPRIHTICESGFNAGHSCLRWLLKANPHAHVYSFDTGAYKYSKPAAAWLQSMFSDRFTMSWGNSTDTLPHFVRKNPDVSCNLIFVNGGDSISTARTELKNLALMANSTYNRIIVDDTFCSSPFCTVPTQAWTESISDGLVHQEVVHSALGGKRGFAIGHFIAPEGMNKLSADVQRLWIKHGPGDATIHKMSSTLHKVSETIHKFQEKFWSKYSPGSGNNSRIAVPLM